MEAAEVAAEQAELALQSSQDEYAASLGAARCAQLQAEVREAPIHRGQRVKVGAKRAAQHAQHKELELLGDGEQLAYRTVWASGSRKQCRCRWPSSSRGKREPGCSSIVSSSKFATLLRLPRVGGAESKRAAESELAARTVWAQRAVAAGGPAALGPSGSRRCSEVVASEAFC